MAQDEVTIPNQGNPAAMRRKAEKLTEKGWEIVQRSSTSITLKKGSGAPAPPKSTEPAASSK